ncbi:hypothetical protein BMS3Bbin04_01365 [bacterium BMS3Bbin04]|nr:hypothetical protein BMS3Bbin04_01365 [bacterium BMS3Bbin04]
MENVGGGEGFTVELHGAVADAVGFVRECLQFAHMSGDQCPPAALYRHLHEAFRQRTAFGRVSAGGDLIDEDQFVRRRTVCDGLEFFDMTGE